MKWHGLHFSFTNSAYCRRTKAPTPGSKPSTTQGLKRLQITNKFSLNAPDLETAEELEAEVRVGEGRGGRREALTQEAAARASLRCSRPDLPQASHVWANPANFPGPQRPR